jgi:hypothetical protein
VTTAADRISIDTHRAQLRSEVSLAARVIPTHYPLETFIAVNPLAGLESMPFEQAVRRAGDLYGIQGVLDETAYRDLYRRGRITDTDLESALRQRYPVLLEGEPIRMGTRVVTPFEVLRSDLLNGSTAPKPSRRNRPAASRWHPGSPSRSTHKPPNGARPFSAPLRRDGRCRTGTTASTTPGARWPPGITR